MQQVWYNFPGFWVRDDGLISQGKDGPWSRGVRLCVNSDKVLKKGHTPKYYFVLPLQEVIYVHRLVALAFCDNPNVKAFNRVDHISGDSLCNKSTNLRWLNAQLNSMNQSGNKNCFLMKRSGKWRSQVTVNGKVHRWGAFKTFRQAHLAALRFKEAEFTKIYRTFITNETETTATSQYLLGRPGPIVLEPPLPGVGVCGACVLRPQKQRVHNPLSKAGGTAGAAATATN